MSDQRKLWQAVCSGTLSKAKELLEAGVDPNISHWRDGSTLLHIAVRTGSSELVRALVQHGAKVDTQDSDDVTPLHLALFYERAEVAALLLEHGADPTLEDRYDETPVQSAGPGVLAWLKEHRPDLLLDLWIRS